ncbi:hypothetical protein [Pigmentiphaga sp. CHJ604]|uniref:hypothetical protein n=1 Tax=Pigmentiphaga sp. CHJ604 TaxID=3081984 RepID=UPI0030CCED1A
MLLILKTVAALLGMSLIMPLAVLACTQSRRQALQSWYAILAIIGGGAVLAGLGAVIGLLTIR